MLLVKDGQLTPRTMVQIMENCTFSRYTVIRHFKEMEAQGLILRTSIARPSKGRPKLLYQPTPLLIKGGKGEAEFITLTFSTLKEN